VLAAKERLGVDLGPASREAFVRMFLKPCFEEMKQFWDMKGNPMREDRLRWVPIESVLLNVWKVLEPQIPESELSLRQKPVLTLVPADPDSNPLDEPGLPVDLLFVQPRLV
jgi:hypothetical protein